MLGDSMAGARLEQLLDRLSFPTPKGWRDDGCHKLLAYNNLGVRGQARQGEQSACFQGPCVVRRPHAWYCNVSLAL